MNYNDFVVWDLETSGKDTKTAQIVQIGAMVIHGRKLQLKAGSEFDLLCKPLYGEEAAKAGLEELSDGAIKVHGKTHELLADKPPIETVLKAFVSYTKQHNFKGTKWGAPISCGYNIAGYDTPILKRELEKIGLEWPFHPIYHLDMMQQSFVLFENNEAINSLSADNLIRNYMGYRDPEGMSGHDALADVIMTAEYAIKYLNLMRGVTSKTKFAGAFAK
jgi:DNA polymerase III epsilon subunit-like protein